MIMEKRPAFLMSYLLKSQCASLNQIREYMQLTRRQIVYDLEKVNYWLKEKELPPIVCKGNVILVPDAVLAFFKESQHVQPERMMNLTEEERFMMIYLYLFIREELISSAHLTQFLQVSKNTVITDVKKANQKNSPFLVEIRYTRQQGYHLKGTEFDKRALVMKQLNKLLQLPYYEKLIRYLWNKRGEAYRFDYFYEILKSLSKRHKLQFVEERFNQFAYFLPFYYCRQKQKKLVLFHGEEINALKQDSLWEAGKEVIQELSVDEDESEICYFTLQLLGLSLGNTSMQIEDRDLLITICEQLVADFETKACMVFERKNEVIKLLYQHMKPAYFRMKYRIPIHNPLLKEIKKEHKELFTLVKEMILPISSLLQVPIPDEEIAFITILFGALLEKPTHHTSTKKKRAVVVCPSGISSSLMVKHQLESVFSEITIEKTVSLEEFYEEKGWEFDLVFSTVSLNTKLPCFYVRPMMTPAEKNQIASEVYHHLFGMNYESVPNVELISIIKKFANIYDEKGLAQALSPFTIYKKEKMYREEQPVLQDLLKEETIQLMEELTSWEEAINMAANPLLNKGVIEKSYVHAIIENVKTLGPYMVIGPGVAIPHARPEMGVRKIGMSFLKLERPVHFLNDKNYPVQLLFFLAAIDNKTHLKALSQLTKLLSKKDNIEFLKKAQSKEEIEELFQTYSTKEN
ncbi:BglG family transcription antiterminator [Niallia nealsonii]|uniref:Ascorbate-specific PTS system EIIA component n=1 Tax=Niallia nealsonii TaxID=115979 RepID=A0A2N0Z553_9BACI|nr:BglG family transcription antiterminator [Niallia nealsonii]PKG24630.1 PTS fructose transporter subunit IIA [Niallia nealsonii]